MASQAKTLAVLTFVALWSVIASQLTDTRFTGTSNTNLLSGTEDLQHSAYLDVEQTVLFKWKAESRYIIAEISAPAKGYIGFGISPAGGMINADILLMWVDDATGYAYLQPRFAIANAEPEIGKDGHNPVWGFTGSQNETHTTFRFMRDIHPSCNASHNASSKFYNIESDATRIIYSFSDTDPTPPSQGSRAVYHGPLKRGTKTLYLLDDQSGAYERDKQAAIRDTTKVLEFKANQLVIPAIQTHYQCEFHKLPEITRDSHIVGFEPIIDGGRQRNIHHFVVFMCDADFVPKDTQKSFACNFDSVDPSDYPDEVTTAKCMVNSLWVWGIGGDSTFMPQDVGYRLTPRHSNRYMIIETHYDNPAHTAGMIDSSGVRLLVLDAPVLRPREASHFWVIFWQTPEIVIPNGLDLFTIPGVCTPQCTQRNLFLKTA